MTQERAAIIETFKRQPLLVDKRHAASIFDFLFPPAIVMETFQDYVEVKVNYGLWPEDHRLIAETMPKAFAAAEVTTRKQVIVKMDSPGGSVQGCFEACYEVAKARAEHPDIRVSVFSEGLIASAAYAHTCAMTSGENDEIVLTPAAEAGSIGVVTSHWDDTKLLADMGTKVQYFAFPPGKADGRFGVELSEEGGNKIQSDIEKLYAMFAQIVTNSRGLDVAAITALNADCFLGSDAVSNGLADRVIESGSLLFEDRIEDDKTQEPADVPEKAPDAPESKKHQYPSTGVITADKTMTDTQTNETALEALKAELEASKAALSAAQASLDADKASIAKLKTEAHLAARPDVTGGLRDLLATKSPEEVEAFLAAMPKAEVKDVKPAKADVIVSAPSVTASANAHPYPVAVDDSKLTKEQRRTLNNAMPRGDNKHLGLAVYDASTGSFKISVKGRK